MNINGFLKRYPVQTLRLPYNSTPMCLINLNYDIKFSRPIHYTLHEARLDTETKNDNTVSPLGYGLMQMWPKKDGIQLQRYDSTPSHSIALPPCFLVRSDLDFSQEYFHAHKIRHDEETKQESRIIWSGIISLLRTIQSFWNQSTTQPVFNCPPRRTVNQKAYINKP